MDSFLPTSAKEMAARGWEAADVILVTGDAYVDHPSCGVAVIGRLLEAEGLRVAILPQPNWRDDLRDFKKLGAPRLFFGVTAGAMDSMVNHYTAAKRLRSDDAYTAGGKAGFRPDRAATVYSKILKSLYPSVPVILGGIEASLRRLTHYDYWDDKLHPSILVDSGADIISYGMGEEAIVDIARVFRNGDSLRELPQVAFMADADYVEKLTEPILLHPHEECVADGGKFGENFVRIETESNLPEPGRIIVEPFGAQFVVVNPPYPLMSTETLDRTAELPYTRQPHPRYAKKGDIPAWMMIRNSVNIHRGCFGGCSFCTISAHQGKFIVSRSVESVLGEVRRLTEMPYFRGNISDLGGPSANMWQMGGRDVALCGRCKRPSCLTPRICPNLDRNHAPLLDLYAAVGAIPGVKKSYIGSGIRYDLFQSRATPKFSPPDPPAGGADDSQSESKSFPAYLREVILHHTSGRLKVAPEHTEEHVLRAMRKPPWSTFEQLHRDFRRIVDDAGLKTQIVPYFISSHPGCTEGDMRALAQKTRQLHLRTEQVQDFTPTPMTLASVMFHTGRDPYTGRKMFVERNPERKKRQKSWFLK